MTTNSSFHSLKELIRALANNEELLSALFERRNVRVRWEDALPLVDEKGEKIEFLIEKGIVQQNADYLEIDEQFQEFFEQVLEINIKISTAYIRESLEVLRNNIEYWISEKNNTHKFGYLRKVKSELRKIGKTVWRNSVDLRRNIEDTFKTEPNYKIKIAKLQRYDQKREDIMELIGVTEHLCFEKEKLFFYPCHR
jgi:hypothetical protein